MFANRHDVREEPLALLAMAFQPVQALAQRDDDRLRERFAGSLGDLSC